MVANDFEFDGELALLPKTYSTDEIKVPTTEEKKFKLIDALKKKLENPPADFPAIREIIDIDGVRVVFEEGWGLIRASNTTPVLVTRFEALSEAGLALIQSKMMEMLNTCEV